MPDGCGVLAASTNYHFVLQRTDFSGGAVELNITRVTAEDSGGAAEWSILDHHSYFVATTWTNEANKPLLIEVRGSFVGAPTVVGPQGQPLNLLSNADQTASGSETLSATTDALGHGFVTGPDPDGYDLGSVGVRFRNDATATLEASVWGSIRFRLLLEYGIPTARYSVHQKQTAPDEHPDFAHCAADRVAGHLGPDVPLCSQAP